MSQPGTAFVVELDTPVPATLASDFLSKLHYVSEGMAGFGFVDGGRAAVQFRLQDEALDRVDVVRTHIREIAAKMTRSFREFRPKVLASRDVTGRCTADPHAPLLAAGELREFGRGRYGLGPRVSELMACFDTDITALAGRMAAPRFTFPSLIGGDVLERCRYLRSFPHSLNLVTHLREDLEAVQAFASDVRWDDHAVRMPAGVTAAPECLLSPSVCFHWYAWLAGQALPRSQPITAIGKCFRYESGSMRGLERLWDFTMREIIFVGTSDYVLLERDRMVEAIAGLLGQWEIGFEISSAMDPFFIEDFSTQTAFQLAFDLKFEIRAALPYSTGSLAAGSFNYHQDFFGKAFGISIAPGRVAHTGCAGFGLERLALAFLAQHGLDRAAWPAAVKQATS